MFTYNNHLCIDVFTDANKVGCPNDKRSTSRYYTFVGNNLVAWHSKRQNIVACSRTKVEYRATTQGVCEALWLKRLFIVVRAYATSSHALLQQKSKYK